MNLIPQKKGSIREKLIAVNIYQSTIPMIVLALVLMFAIAAFSIMQMYRSSNDIMYSIEVSSESFLGQYNQSMDEVYKVLISNWTGKDKNKILLDYVESNEFIESLMILNENGIAISGAPKEIVDVGLDYSGYDYFKEVMVPGDMYWSDIYITFGSTIPHVTVSKKYDNVIVVIEVDLETLTHFLESFDISKNSCVGITDSASTYVAHTDHSFVITRTIDRNRESLMKEEPQYVTYNQQFMLAFHRELKINNWSIVFYQSIWDLMMPLITVIGIGIVMIVVISTGVLRGVMKINRELSNEVNELVVWSEKVTKGQYEIALKDSIITEFNELYDAFNIMTQSILSREEKLEKQQEQIVEINKGLEIEVHNRTEDLEETLRNLQKTQEQLVQKEKMASLGRLVSGVAHELNTPIGVAMTAISYLEQKNDLFISRLQEQRMSKEDLQTYMTVVGESTEILFRNMNRASDLITSFKKVAIDQEKMALEKIKINEVIEATVTSLSVVLKRKSVDVALNYYGDLQCLSYAGAVSQVMTNLIQNSLMHAFEFEENPLIRIDCREEVETDTILIEYWDNGRGIPEHDLDKIYEPFFTTAIGEGGTGLGMNIVFTLVTGSLLGTIYYIHKDEGGACFHIRIPKKLK